MRNCMINKDMFYNKCCGYDSLSGSEKHIRLIVILLVVSSFFAYGRILTHDFINFDDPGFIFENRHIQAGFTLESIQWAFSTIENNYWIPVTWLSHILDWNIYQANPAGHHLISLLLHIGAVIFLFLFLNKTTGHIWSAAFAAAFFALHPLRVESVAWASERKDVLSMFFGMATLYTYAFYAENHKASRYFLCLILFTLALMSKPMMVTLPFVLLLLDYWPLHRWQKALSDPLENRLKTVCKIVLEKVPFFLFAIALSLITIWAQKHEGSVASTDILPLATRTGNAIISYTGYLEKIFWPYNLAAFYPYEYSPIIWKMVISLLFLILITTLVFVYIRKLPFLFVGWAWYLGTLIPVIGLIQVGKQSMADRYTYLPSIGIAMILAWTIPSLIKNQHIRNKIIFPAAICCLLLMTFLSWHQSGHWENSIKLWSHALQMTNHNHLAYGYRGNAYIALNQYQKAMNDFNQSINITRDYYFTYKGKTTGYRENGHDRRALEDYNSAMISRGNAYFLFGQYKLAINDYNMAIQLKPDNRQSYCNRGNAFENLGQYQRAIHDYTKAINMNPNDVQSYYNRGNSYNKLGQYQRAIDDYNQAIRIKHDYSDAYNNRGNAYAGLGLYQLAIDNYNKAILLKPDDIKIYHNRFHAYVKSGDNPSGCRDAKRVCDLGQCDLLEWAKSKNFCR